MLLGVARSASRREIHRAYRRLVRDAHPDLTGGDDERVKALNEAWAVLRDERLRRDYDATLPPEARPGRPPNLVAPPGFEVIEVKLTYAGGDQWFTGVRDAHGLRARTADLTPLVSLPPGMLRRLDLAGTGVTDRDLGIFERHATVFDRLHHVDLADTPITDAALRHLRCLPRLQVLVLFGTRITDAGARSLADHPTLTTLDLRETSTSTAALTDLVAMPALAELRASHVRRGLKKLYAERRPDVALIDS